MQYNGFSIDIEADGFVFEARNIWSLCLEDLDTDRKLRINPFGTSTASLLMVSVNLNCGLSVMVTRKHTRSF